MIVAMTASEPLIRPCGGCQVFDDHPRHEIITFDGADAHGGPMHMDCCAVLRSCDVCRMQLERTHAHVGVQLGTGDDPSRLKGAALRAALVELPPVLVEHAETATSPFDVAEAQEMVI